MRALKDEHLIECYLQAVEWQLDEAFIDILLKEIVRRNLDVPGCRAPKQAAAS